MNMPQSIQMSGYPDKKAFMSMEPEILNFCSYSVADDLFFIFFSIDSSPHR